MPEIKEIVFKDLPLSFIPHPITGNITMNENEMAVKDALKNLILTNLYEKPYMPLFGSDVTGQLFEHFTSITAHQLKKNITIAIENYEPRVELISIDFDDDTYDNNSLNVSIKFRLVNNPSPQTLNLVLERVR